MCVIDYMSVQNRTQCVLIKMYTAVIHVVPLVNNFISAKRSNYIAECWFLTYHRTEINKCLLGDWTIRVK